MAKGITVIEAHKEKLNKFILSKRLQDAALLIHYGIKQNIVSHINLNKKIGVTSFTKFYSFLKIC